MIKEWIFFKNDRRLNFYLPVFHKSFSFSSKLSYLNIRSCQDWMKKWINYQTYLHSVIPSLYILFPSLSNSCSHSYTHNFLKWLTLSKLVCLQHKKLQIPPNHAHKKFNFISFINFSFIQIHFIPFIATCNIGLATNCLDG